MDKELKLKKQREYRQANGNSCTNKYEKTLSGFLMRKYRNMYSRVSGVQAKKAHIYIGLDILPKDEFREWALSCEEFIDMFRVYKESGYNRKLCPTVDRIDSSAGYIKHNMQWLTHSENSRKGSNSRWSKNSKQD
jgi:hypothetical protein